MKRIDVSLRYPAHNCAGSSCEVFEPDFTFDNNLYKEVVGLNEISLALSKHSLADSVRMRLQEFTPPPSFTDGLSDTQILDNMIPSEMDTSTLLSLAHDLESEIIDSKND